VLCVTISAVVNNIGVELVDVSFRGPAYECLILHTLHPCSDAALQRSHTGDTLTMQEQCHTGTGSFVRSRAKQHDVAVSRYFVTAFGEIFGGHTQSSWNRVVRVLLHAKPQIDDHNILAGFEHPMKFFRSDTRHGELAQEAAAVYIFAGDPSSARQHQQDYDRRAHAEGISSNGFELIGKQVAKAHIRRHTTEPRLSNSTNFGHQVRELPAMGAATAFNPGINLDTSSERNPYFTNAFSVWRTHESGSRLTRQIKRRMRLPRARPS